MPQHTDIVSELRTFLDQLVTYFNYRKRQRLSKGEWEHMSGLFGDIGRKVGHFGPLISELTGLDKVTVGEREKDMWLVGLRIENTSIVAGALQSCVHATNRAIGRLEDDIKNGIRDKETGLLVTPQTKRTTEPPKAFIAHEGETEQLKKLKDFLEALGIKYFLAETQASDGRSIEGQVDWTQGKADFAVCLATKGKAINKKTGKHYMAPNIIDELGRARQVFGNKIILLVQKGVEVHTNIREIVYETFTTTNMEKAFIKIIKELKNWGFLTTGKIKE